MRQLTLTEPGHLSWWEVPEPALTDGRAALVEPVAAATCDFDHLVHRGHMTAPPPVAIGHECVARVLEVGADVTSVSPGDLVVLPFQISCGVCGSCRRGATNACEAGEWLSCYGLGAMSGDWGGVVSDVLAVPHADAMLVPLPAGVSATAAAAVGCNIVDAYRCVGPQLDAIPGAPVLVLSGAFPNIAHYTVQLAVGLGAERVVFFDPRHEVAAKAERLGAELLDDPASLAPRSFPIVVDASMRPALLEKGIETVARGGFVTVSTMYTAPTTPVPMMRLFETAAVLQSGQPHVRALMEPVLDLVAAGVIDPMAVVDGTCDWSEADRAFGAGSGKHVVHR